MSVAFCFPGQGALEMGMGRELAEAMPEVMEVYERGSEACDRRGEKSLRACRKIEREQIPVGAVAIVGRQGRGGGEQYFAAVRAEARETELALGAAGGRLG